MRSEGSAFLDRSGRVIAADPAFRSCLGLTTEDTTVALRARAEGDTVLRALLAGEGPDVARIGAPGAELELERSTTGDGLFLRARSAGGLAGPALEHAMHSAALARVASGVAHDVKNPLNAMALQIALLTDKIGGAGDDLPAACANNLASLKNQIGRVNEVVRRLADVADPVGGTAFDAAALANDVASLLCHDARRRRVALACEAGAVAMGARGDGARAARVLLGLVWRATASAQEGGKVSVRARVDHGEVVLTLEHAPIADPALAWIPEVAAEALREMGGRLVSERGAEVERLELRFRRDVAP